MAPGAMSRPPPAETDARFTVPVADGDYCVKRIAT
jgi:hypothetical protein